MLVLQHVRVEPERNQPQPTTAALYVTAQCLHTLGELGYDIWPVSQVLIMKDTGVHVDGHLADGNLAGFQVVMTS